MAATFIIYFVLIGASYIWLDDRFSNGLKIFSLFVFLLILSFRYEVGGDWRGYVNDYNSANWDRYEFLYASIGRFLSFLRLPYHGLIGLIAFLQIVLIRRLRDCYNVSGLIIFFYFALLFFFESLSILRQMVAVPLFYLLLEFVIMGKLANSLLLLLVMLGFHSSSLVALILIPLARILGKASLRTIYTILPLILIFILNIDFYSLFQDLVRLAFNYHLIPSQGYAVMDETLFFAKNDYLGYGFYLYLWTSIVVLWKYKNLKANPLLRGVWLIQLILFPVVQEMNNIGISRLYMYVSFSNVLVYSIIFGSLGKTYYETAVKYISFVGYIVYFIVALSRGAAHSSPFTFSFYA